MCLTEFAGKGDLVNMSKVQMLLSLKKQRLTVEEIFTLFEKTIAELEEELSLSKEENKRLQKLLDAVLQPQLRIHRAGLFPLPLINTLHSSVTLYYHIDNTLDQGSATFFRMRATFTK